MRRPVRYTPKWDTRGCRIENMSVDDGLRHADYITSYIDGVDGLTNEEAMIVLLAKRQRRLRVGGLRLFELT